MNLLKQLTEERIRKEIQNITDSYNHPWDVLAELCQNSVDAINQYNKSYGEVKKKEHKIKINIDAKDRSIKIFDTGRGFDANKLAMLLGPHGTDKPGAGTTIGEKGVGLTYTIFQANYYEIRSKSTETNLQGYIEQAALWRQGRIKDYPKFKPQLIEKSKSEPEETYTEILLKDIETFYSETEDLFNQSINVIEFILRTKTAIGHLKNFFGQPKLEVSVELTFSDINGKKQTLAISPSYMLPEGFVSKPSVIDYEDFKSKSAKLDDKQRAQQLQGKSIRKIGAESRAGHNINYYIFMAPSRKLWAEISDKNKIYYHDTEGEKVDLYESGIYVASRGMPTGIRLEPPTTGWALGYWANFYFILEDDSINFDLGRKSIPGRIQRLLRDIAKQWFNEFLPYIQFVSKDTPVTGATTATIQQYQKSKVFEELRGLADINISDISYLKHPNRQEAAVVALFHELVGAKILKGYQGLRTGYKQTYDLWSIYKIEKDLIAPKYAHLADSHGFIELPTVLEFKYNADDILNDFDKDIKFFTDIDLIVCWDFDETKFAKQSVKVNVMPKDDVLFYGSNFVLEWPGAYNLGIAAVKPVLSLRRFTQDHINK